MATMVARLVVKGEDDVLFTTLSIVMLAIVLVGFAPSPFFKGAVFAHLPSVLMHLHGVAFSS